MKEYSLFNHFNRYLDEAHKTRMSDFAAAGEFVKKTYLEDLVRSHDGQWVTNTQMIFLLTKVKALHDYMFHACGHADMGIKSSHEFVRDFCAQVLWTWASGTEIKSIK